MSESTRAGLVACLLQPLAQARERRDITSRTRCHDQDLHYVSPVALLRSSAAASPTIIAPSTRILSSTGGPAVPWDV
jgi:hypothetical protein